ncbi:MAG: molybdopterin-dependent oxidoreductase, partial [Pseudomonadota bacterium]
NILHTAASRVGGLDLGFVPGEGGMGTAEMLTGSDVLFLLGSDELDMTQRKSGFTVYIGSHGDVGAHHADVILPAATYTEKSGTWVNTEGRVQMGSRAAFAPGEAREDWAILRALSDVLGKKLPFDSLAQLRAKLYEAHPHFAAIDEVAESDGMAALDALAARKGKVDGAPLTSSVDDFYLTNPIARASAVMAECSQRAKGTFAEAAE